MVESRGVESPSINFFFRTFKLVLKYRPISVLDEQNNLIQFRITRGSNLKYVSFSGTSLCYILLVFLFFLYIGSLVLFNSKSVLCSITFTKQFQQLDTIFSSFICTMSFCFLFIRFFSSIGIYKIHITLSNIYIIFIYQNIK